MSTQQAVADLPHDAAGMPRTPSVRDMPIGSTETMEILIKSPSLIEDFAIKMRLSDSVATLKQQISQELPLHPSIEDQRLVYSGKLLRNEELLTDVFRKVRAPVQWC